jgi:hypothetical protein
MFVQDGFFYLIVTKHKLTVRVEARLKNVLDIRAQICRVGALKITFRRLYSGCETLCLTNKPSKPHKSVQMPFLLADCYTLIKKKTKFSSYIRKFRGIGCKVI